MSGDTGKLHLCVGFYLNGTYKANTVRDEDLESNIAYNREYRPGRFYFVDGEYACGGMLVPEAQAKYIAECKARIAELGLKPLPYDTRPYV